MFVACLVYICPLPNFASPVAVLPIGMHIVGVVVDFSLLLYQRERERES